MAPDSMGIRGQNYLCTGDRGEPVPAVGASPRPTQSEQTNRYVGFGAYQRRDT